MTKMVSGKETGQRQKCLPACQENNFHPTTELSAAYPPPLTDIMDFTTHFNNNHNFCFLLIKLIDYCKDPYIKDTLENTYPTSYTHYINTGPPSYTTSTTDYTMCSGLNQVDNMIYLIKHHYI